MEICVRAQITYYDINVCMIVKIRFLSDAVQLQCSSSRGRIVVHFVFNDFKGSADCFLVFLYLFSFFKLHLLESLSC